MTKTKPPVPASGLRLTPRETAAWELSLGMKLSEFPESYTTALTAWKMAKDRGHAITMDEALDTPWEDIAAQVGAVDPTQPPSSPTPETSDETTVNASP